MTITIRCSPYDVDHFNVTILALPVCVYCSVFLLLPVCRYPPLSGHQYDITQLSGPQVALHLAEGHVGVGQSGEHTLLWTRTWLQRHAGGQCGAAVRRPEQRQPFTQTKRRRQKLWVHVLVLILFCSRQRDRCVERATPAAPCHPCAIFVFVPFPHTYSPSLLNRVTVCRQKQTKAL